MGGRSDGRNFCILCSFTQLLRYTNTSRFPPVFVLYVQLQVISRNYLNIFENLQTSSLCTPRFIPSTY